MLETQDDWVLHGFSFANYVADLGASAQSDIYRKTSVDLAMRDAFRKRGRSNLAHLDRLYRACYAEGAAAVLQNRQYGPGHWLLPASKGDRIGPTSALRVDAAPFGKAS